MRTLIFLLLLSSVAFSMTKQEMVDSLRTVYDAVRDPELVRDTLPNYNVKHYQMVAFYIESDSVLFTEKTIKMSVKDEGLASECAVIMRRMPDPDNPILQFLPDIKAYLEGESIILKNITQSSFVDRWAECNVYEWDGANTQWLLKKILVRKPASVFIYNDVVEQ